VLGDPAQHLGAEFIVVVEGKHDVRHLGVGQSPVRSRLAFDGPTQTNQSREYAACLGRRPIIHAARKET
jgi:hypothetical protein